MTIRDMLDAGIEIQGPYTIRMYEDDLALSSVRGENFEDEYYKNVPDIYLVSEIIYMFCEHGTLNIEVAA